MAKWIKKLKSVFRRHPWAKWAALGGAAALIGIVVLLLILGGHEPEKPPLGSSGNIRTITLVAGGDLNVTDNTVASGKVGETYDYTQNFLDVAEVFAGADAAFLNFEGTFSGESYGSATASAPLALAQTLSACGVDFLQTANSRSVSNGIWGLSQTLSAIRSCGMEPLGTYESNADFHQQQGFTLRTIGGIKVAFVAFTKGMDGMGLPSGSEKCVNLLYTDYTTTYKKINTQGITDIFEAVEKAKPDITVALLHWGSEGNSAISPSQKKIANLMLSLGVDAIIGTHSHYVQQMTFDEKTGQFVAYSLGDFLSDGTQAGTNYSVVLDLEITKDGVTGETKITDYSWTPIYLLDETDSGGGLRLLRMEHAIQTYEQEAEGSISEEDYLAMKNCMERIEARVKGE